MRIDGGAPIEVAEEAGSAMDAYYDEEYLKNVIARCRDASDVPQFNGSRIIGWARGTEHAAFYVPDGNHSLSVTATWQPMEFDSTADDETKDATARQKTWDIPLQPSSGYCLNDAKSDAAQPLSWRLTGNHEQFTTATGTVPLPLLAATALPENPNYVFTFPNQYKPQYPNRSPADGTEICEWGYEATTDAERWKITLRVAVISDSPRAILASHVDRGYVPSGFSLGEYLGLGRFALVPK
jgi:hypothetical protein